MPVVLCTRICDVFSVLEHVQIISGMPPHTQRDTGRAVPSVERCANSARTTTSLQAVWFGTHERFHIRRSVNGNLSCCARMNYIVAAVCSAKALAPACVLVLVRTGSPVCSSRRQSLV